MAVRVERDVVISVPAIEPGSERKRYLELREGSDGCKVNVDAGKHGSEVAIADLRAALDKAEEEFNR